MDMPVNALLSALQSGVDGGAGRRAPGTTRYLNNAQDQARLQAEDEANFARMAAQRGAAQPMAAPPQGGIVNGYNSLVNALNPQR